MVADVAVVVHVVVEVHVVVDGGVLDPVPWQGGEVENKTGDSGAQWGKVETGCESSDGNFLSFINIQLLKDQSREIQHV